MVASGASPKSEMRRDVGSTEIAESRDATRRVSDARRAAYDDECVMPMHASEGRVCLLPLPLLLPAFLVECCRPSRGGGGGRRWRWRWCFFLSDSGAADVAVVAGGCGGDCDKK